MENQAKFKKRFLNPDSVTIKSQNPNGFWLLIVTVAEYENS